MDAITSLMASRRVAASFKGQDGGKEIKRRAELLEKCKQRQQQQPDAAR